MLLRHSTLHFDDHPSVARVVLVAFVVALLAPIIAMALAFASLAPQPRSASGWFGLLLGIVTLAVQTYVLLSTKWI
jgi:hypothetical protein